MGAHATEASKPLLQSWCDLWTLNPYDQCEFRCTYCVTNAQGTSLPKVSIEDAHRALATELEQGCPKHSIVIGGMSDAYPPIEEELGLTRHILKDLIARQLDIHIVTKSRLILRDLDLLVPYAHACKIQVSISSLDDDALRTLEPLAPTATERLRLVGELLAAGIDVTVAATPWIPGLTNACELCDAVPEAVPIQFGPLSLYPGRTIHVLGRRYDQEEINRLYLEDRAHAGYDPRVRWLYPAGWDWGASTHYLLSFMPPGDLLQPPHSPA